MPTLDLAQLRALRAEPPHVCGTCGRAVAWNYCRQCDVYFEAGHLRHEPDDIVHDAHRTY